MAELNALLTWTFVSETPVPDDITSILVQGEQPVAAYKTLRDVAIFTNLRLIVRDAQGLTGKKVEAYSLPYSSINMWSSENAKGVFDSSELELWTKAGHVKVKLSKGVDVRKLDHIISQAVLKN